MEIGPSGGNIIVVVVVVNVKQRKKEKDADGNWTLLSGVIATDSAIASNNSLCNVKYKMSFTCFQEHNSKKWYFSDCV